MVSLKEMVQRYGPDLKRLLDKLNEAVGARSRQYPTQVEEEVP